MLNDSIEERVAVVEHVGHAHARPLEAELLEESAPLSPRVAHDVVAVDPEDVKGGERHRDRAVAVEHAVAEQRPVRRAGRVEGDELSRNLANGTTALLDGRVARQVLDASVTEAVRRSLPESLPY